MLAMALGIHETTLCRWQHDDADRAPSAAAKRSQGRGAGFRMVQVADTRPTRVASASVPVSTARSLRVAHAPSGLVIDGLDVESLAALLQRMS